MIDFFSALLDSQFSGASPLKPRIPARFEPLTPRVDPVFEDGSWEGQAPEFPRAESGSDARRTAQSAPKESMNERAPYRGILSVPPRPRDVNSSESIAPAQADAPRVARSPDPAADPSRTERDAQSARDAQTRLRAQTDREPRPAGEKTVAPIRPAPSSEPRAPEPHPAPEPQASLSSQGAPVVRVTIGRIVVRAVQPGAERPPKRAPAPAKKLSLDDYLSKNERGER